MKKGGWECKRPNYVKIMYRRGTSRRVRGAEWGRSTKGAGANERPPEGPGDTEVDQDLRSSLLMSSCRLWTANFLNSRAMCVSTVARPIPRVSAISWLVRW